METLKACVVGVGAMGANHCRVYSEMPGVDLVGVCDLDTKAAKDAGARYRCQAFGSYGKLLSAMKPDIVSVVVPTRHHREVAVRCAQSGASLLVEKPIAGTVEDAKAIIKAAEKAGVKLMVGHIERFNPAVQEMKRRVDAKELGRIFSINAVRVGPFPARIRDVGVVIDLAVHDIDCMRYITDSEVKRVFAETEKRIHTSCEDMLSGLLKFKNGVVGVLDVNWLTPEKIRELTVTGERGMFYVKYISQELTFYENRHANKKDYGYQDILMGVSEGDITQIRVQKKEPLRQELDAFIGSVRDDTKPPVTGLDGLKNLQIAQAMIEAASNGQVVPL
ncbi:MAG: Gfo/Idh/MocA family oxidoreductase [Candidatus Altiarchaeota archaeon]